MKTRFISSGVPALLAYLLCAPVPMSARAGQFDITGPAGSGSFGARVTVLPNGNFVVTDPTFTVPGPITNAGAVYLYDGITLALISTLTGSAAGDRIGNGGVTVLSNGNYVVLSTVWNGSRAAVTWGSQTNGVNGVVSAANSLVGSTAGDQVGNTGVTALNNGNYVVSSPSWRNGAVTNAGAVTWGSGATGSSGTISAANSLVGTTTNDGVGGFGATALINGNYVANSPSWNGTRGAATWGNGTVGAAGAVSAANSLVGSTVNDKVGSGHVTVLANGNYVVKSPSWNNGAATNAGAATWGNGTNGVTGAVSAANSLVGTAANDSVGNDVTALINGNYVVSSFLWINGAATNAGAATWGDGSTGISGPVSGVNSLVGTTANDFVGNDVTALNNGNYVVSSPLWENGAATNAGAATWGNGTSGVKGAVTATNSLVGSTANDRVGINGVIALVNGNYVVRSSSWHNGAVTNAGAVTWGSGATGSSGTISAANSLVGSAVNDQVGNNGVTTLANGNYVVSSFSWNGSRGAATWGNGTSGVAGAVSAANSLVGTNSNDGVGYPGVTALANGNYVVRSSSWSGTRGAATWGSGTSGLSGAVSAVNSLIGSAATDQVGSGGAIALANGNYVVSSPLWSGSVGAATWGSGTTGVNGLVSFSNSLSLNFATGQVSSGGVTALADGNYVVSSPQIAAVSLCDGTLGASGTVAAANSVLGGEDGAGSSMIFAYDLVNTRLLVGDPVDNRVSLFGYAPKIAVQQPVNVNLADGATIIFGAPVGTNSSLTFTIKNINVADLTGLGITIDGGDAALFTVTASPKAPVSGPFGSTTFTVRFAPTSPGTKTAALHLASNDAKTNPFNINLSGRVLLFTQDSDGDGLSDAAEFYWSALGFDWQVSQPSLVNTFLAEANSTGLYNTNQIQALNVGGPLIQRNPSNGLFTLTIGVQKSTDLLNFSPFPMSAPQTTINAQGELEFQFSVPDNAAFFRLESH